MIRYIIISIPGRDSADPADWFVYDQRSRRSVGRCSGFADARDRARELNGEALSNG